ncbi:hypothetical protein WJX81_002480 [Elliptochloris bilobata]|uniref:Endonuclease/exonuclease/phosphatase domain-containing protein n=1 Tax=Elliptochloris bilobata TaxID=381761 RepID=A0AAW1SIY3_9CHLO
MIVLPRPGELVFHDFRQQPGHLEPGRPVRLFQWNVERGYKLDAIIQELAREDARDPLDIIAVQEVDIGCERSACEDTGTRVEASTATLSFPSTTSHTAER